VRVVDHETTALEIEVPIPAVGVAPELNTLLGIAARSEAAAPVGSRPQRGQRPAAREAQ
jgi:hypothetical protein